MSSRMLLSRLACSAPLASLALACAHSPAPAPVSHPVRATTAEESYVTIVPHVSVSRDADDTPQERAALDPNADVMAEILAIPPGG
jgi:hypothetical protein